VCGFPEKSVRPVSLPIYFPSGSSSLAPLIAKQLTIARAAAPARGNAALEVCLALFTVGLGRSAASGESTIITFDAPGAGTSAGQGTFAFSINQRGDDCRSGLLPEASFGRHNRSLKSAITFTLGRCYPGQDEGIFGQLQEFHKAYRY
jgi:hypothetical protein